MEDTSSTAFTADGLQPTNDEMKNANDIEQQHQRRPRTAGGNGRWCTSSVRSRSSTSFLIHNLLISCSGGASDVPTTPTSPSPFPQVGHDDENEDTSSSCSGESKSGSYSPRQVHPVSSPVMNSVRDARAENGPDGAYIANHYRTKRRKCAIPSRRRAAKKKDSISSANASGDSDNEQIESKKIRGVRKSFLTRPYIVFNKYPINVRILISKISF